MAAHIGKKIKALRQERELTQSDLATLIGATQGYIARLELGHMEPSLDVLRKIKKKLKAEWDYLLG